MTNIDNLIRKDLQEFKPYSSAADESSIAEVKLNANELPWKKTISIDNVALNRYGEKQPKQLLTSMANYYQVAPQQVLITRGSDEAIDLIVRLFCEAGKDAIITCPPTFGMYQVAAALQGAKVIESKLTADKFEVDAEAILNKWQPNVKLIFLCSPNNPTANLISLDAIKKLCNKFNNKSIVVIDEAYIEFANSDSCCTILKDYDNLIVLRTLSKAFGYANARVGVAIANEKIISWLIKLTMPYPFSDLVTMAAMQALSTENIKQMQQDVTIILQQKKMLIQQLQSLKIVEKIWPSATNFLLVKFNINAVAACSKHNISLRDFSKAIGNYVTRITIGTEAENQKLLDILRELS